MKYAYSPHTGEIINTDAPSDWMGTTNITPPVFDAAVSGCFFRDGAWVVETSSPDVAQLSADARRLRNALIAQTDWTQLPDSPLSTTQKTAWVVYRKSLRDISKQSGFPITIDWPAQP